MEIVNIWDCFKLLNVLFRHCRAQSSGVKFEFFGSYSCALTLKTIIPFTTYILTQLKPTAMTYTQSYDVFLWLLSFDVEHTDWVIILYLDQWLNIASRPRQMRKFMQYTTHHPPPTTMNVFCGPFWGKHQSQIHGDLTCHYDTNAYMYVEASKAIALCLTKAGMCHSWLPGRWRWTPHCRALSGH